MPRFFVMHLNERDLSDGGQASAEKPYEIQLLDKQGRAKAVGHVGAVDETLDIGGYKVPTPVVEAACRQATGHGDYVDERGMSIQPF